MDGNWRDPFALVELNLARLGIPVSAYADSEIWEVAAMLGANRVDEDEDPLADAAGYSWNQQRAIALARGEPEPSWDDVPMSPREIADMERLMGSAPVGLMPPADA